MPKSPRGARSPNINFRQFLKACARDAPLIALFNRLYGFDLPCPITALVDELCEPRSSEETLAIGCFVVFVKAVLWQRFKRAQLNMDRMQRTRARRLGAGVLARARAARDLA